MPTDSADSTSDSTSKAKQTRFANAATVRLLVQPGPRLAPVITQGKFGPGVPDGVLREGPNKKKRCIRDAGCGMCALTSYLAAAGLKAPRYDPMSKTFTVEDSGTPVTPGTFNRYLWNKVDCETTAEVSRESLIKEVYAPDGYGALNWKSSTLIEWIGTLIQLNGFSADIGLEIADPITFSNPRMAVDIPELTAHLETGEPAIVGVSFATKPAVTMHQILVIGDARIGSRVYYLVLDSGFGQLTPAPLLKLTNPMPIAQVMPYAISEQQRSGADGPKTYAGITWIRPLSGLSSLTKFSLLEDWSMFVAIPQNFPAFLI